MEIKNTIDKELVARFISERIIESLEKYKEVFWFVTGGSSIEIISLASLQIAQNPHKNLTITLTDERYGAKNHDNSNWSQLLKSGFNLPDAKIIPVLSDQDPLTTPEKFNNSLKEMFNKENYKIGVFGIGADGHTAGILPQSIAVNSEEYACYYETPKFNRITMTPKAISLLNEGIVFMKGEEKWPVVEDLLNKNTAIAEQPAQILKTLPKLTIFTDYENK